MASVSVSWFPIHILSEGLTLSQSADTVAGMVHYDLDTMFIYTVTLGFVGLLMAWEITCMALKGWAARKEAGHPTGLYRATAARERTPGN